MNEYFIYIIGSFGITLSVLVILLVWNIRRFKELKKQYLSLRNLNLEKDLLDEL